MQSLQSSTTTGSSSSEAVFLASIEAKLRKPFSSLNVSKAIEREADPVTFTTTLKDLVFQTSNSDSAATAGAGSSSSSLTVDKTLKLRLLLSLLGFEKDNFSSVTTSGSNDKIWSVLWDTLQNAQDSNEDIWVRMVGGYAQGYLFGRLNENQNVGNDTSKSGSTNNGASNKGMLNAYLGDEAESKLQKTNLKFIKEVLKAWNKLSEYSNNSRNHAHHHSSSKNNNDKDIKDEIALYAPVKYHFLDPCILRRHFPSLYDNSHFVTATEEVKNRSSSSTANILSFDFENDQQRALEEEREMEDAHSNVQNDVSDSAVSSSDFEKGASGPGHGSTLDATITNHDDSARKNVQDHEKSASNNKGPGGGTSKVNAINRKGVSATAKMLKSGVSGPPRSAFSMRGARPGGARGGSTMSRVGGGGMSEAAKKALAARQLRLGSGGGTARGAVGSVATSSLSAAAARSTIGGTGTSQYLASRMQQRKNAAAKAAAGAGAGGKMKMAVLDVSDVLEMEKERRMGNTTRRRGGRGGGRGGAGNRAAMGSSLAANRSMKRPMAMSPSNNHDIDRTKRAKDSSMGFGIFPGGNSNARGGDKGGEDSDDEEVSKTEVDIIGRFGVAAAATAASDDEGNGDEEEDDDDDDDDDNDATNTNTLLGNNPLNLDTVSGVTTTTTNETESEPGAWGMSMPDLQTNLMFGSSMMSNPFGSTADDDEEEEDDDDDE